MASGPGVGFESRHGRGLQGRSRCGRRRLRSCGRCRFWSSWADGQAVPGVLDSLRVEQAALAEMADRVGLGHRWSSGLVGCAACRSAGSAAAGTGEVDWIDSGPGEMAGVDGDDAPVEGHRRLVAGATGVQRGAVRRGEGRPVRRRGLRRALRRGSSAKRSAQSCLSRRSAL